MGLRRYRDAKHQMRYTVKRKFVGNSQLFFELSKESGKLYSRTVKFFWRIVRKQGIWLKPSSMMRLFNSDKLHAHSADASVQSFYHSLSSWREHRKSDPSCRPPKRCKFFFNVTWKNTAIRIKNGTLILSNGRYQEPVLFNNWKYSLPKQAILRWAETEYEIIFVYTGEDIPPVKPGKIVGVDIGQIHVAACSDGMILNGRKLRSIRQWRDKKIADLQSKIAHKKRGWQLFIENLWKSMFTCVKNLCIIRFL